MDYARYVNIDSRNVSFLILNCIQGGVAIEPKYELRIFLISINDKYEATATRVAFSVFNRGVFQADIVSSPLKSGDFNLVLQADYNVAKDSVIYLVDMT